MNATAFPVFPVTRHHPDHCDELPEEGDPDVGWFLPPIRLLDILDMT
jgi:hypothetical protein